MQKRHVILLDILIIYTICIFFRIFAIYPLDIFGYKEQDIYINYAPAYSALFDGDYRYYTDKGVFVNRDSMIRRKANSHDVQSYISQSMHDRRNNCHIVTAGPRIYTIGKLSFLPNILSIKCH